MGRLKECVICKRYKARLKEALIHIEDMERERKIEKELVEVIFMQVLKKQDKITKNENGIV